MTSSYYPVTTNKQSQSIHSTTHYPSYQVSKTTNKNYSDDDDDLDELRKAALKTLNSKKRKNTYNHSRSTSRTYSSSSSHSSYTHSSISRSNSSSSLSSISSNSLDKNDKDYRFETKEKQTNGDIDERFPQDIPNDDDMLILNCPIHDDDLLKDDEPKKSDQNHSKPSSSSKPVKSKKETRKKSRSPSIERPVSITVKLNSDEFDLRQLIKKRRTDESSGTNQRVVQILPKTVHKTVHDRLSSNGRSSDKKHHKH